MHFLCFKRNGRRALAASRDGSSYRGRLEGLFPGDLIVTGAPSGVGAVRKPLVFMNAGDICEVEIERIGILRHRIVNETAAVAA